MTRITDHFSHTGRSINQIELQKCYGLSKKTAGYPKKIIFESCEITRRDMHGE